jgi:transcription factor WhiB
VTRIRSSHEAPATQRPDDWRKLAACLGHRDEMFPDSLEREIAHAKAICAQCPVWEACLDDALQTGDNEHGIRGGLKPRERRNLAKLRATQPAIRIEPPRPRKVREARPATLAEAFTRRAQRTPDGHVLWHGANHLQYDGKRYTALQAAFTLGHGREPEGLVRRTCRTECFRWDHLADQVIRDAKAVCGTRPGYDRHRRNGEAACQPCLQAKSASNGRRPASAKAAAT